MPQIWIIVREYRSTRKSEIYERAYVDIQCTQCGDIRPHIEKRDFFRHYVPKNTCSNCSGVRPEEVEALQAMLKSYRIVNAYKVPNTEGQRYVFFDIACITCDMIRIHVTKHDLLTVYEKGRCDNCSGLQSAFMVTYATYRLNAAQVGRAFTLTHEEFRTLTSLPCHYCGHPPTNMTKDKHRHRNSNRYKKFSSIYIYNGLDRLDNTKGYDITNAVPCCMYCNIMKNDRSFDDFLLHIHRIAQRYPRAEPLPPFSDIPTLPHGSTPATRATRFEPRPRYRIHPDAGKTDESVQQYPQRETLPLFSDTHTNPAQNT